MKNFGLVFSWYAATCCSLILSLVLLFYISLPQKSQVWANPHYQMYQALPNPSLQVKKQTVEIIKTDGRANLIADFFQRNNSPLRHFAHKFIETADFYKLDFRLLPAIAMQESNGGKKMPKNSFNPFGFGIYGGQILRFASFEEAIERVGKDLRRDYLDQGLSTPYQIMAKYTPSSLQKEGAWALGVSAFIEQIN